VKTDIAVVGSGLAALTAVRALRQAGRDVTLVWPGLTSLYFLAATVDVLGYADVGAGGAVQNPSDGVARLIAEHPDHPYALAGLPALQAGLALLLDWFKEAGLDWQGSPTRNLMLPTATGTPKPSCLVPVTMAAGDLDDPMPIVLCGFAGYQDFAPELAASNLQRSWAKGSRRVTAVRIGLPGFNPDRLFTSIDIARRFEEPSFVTEVGALIQAAIPAGPVRIGLPAVLGLTRTRDIHAALMARAGHPVFEIPTLPPSVPALRLFDRLRKQLQETGTELIWAAPAHAAEVHNRRCTRISLKAAGREQPLEARAFILALEDWVDGAFRAGVHLVREPFFGNVIAEHPKPADRTAPSLFSPQPYAQLGYRVTDHLQPADEAGTPLADNVFIAGGAIAGYDPSGTKSRGGMAVATGYRAAQEALAA